jgi:phage tail sheath protein FI
MRTYLAPGVYRAPPAPTDADIRLVRTDIAGFVDYAERGPIAPADSPSLPDPSTLAVRLTSWDEYRARFGGLTHYAYMPYAVRAFFENGGTTCYVARVAASTSADPSSVPRTAWYTLPTGNLATPATTLGQAAAAGATNLTVASTAGLAPGAVLAIGDLNAPAVAVVATVVDGQNLTLSGPLETAAAAGAAVQLAEAAVLANGATAGQTDVQVASTELFQTGDTVAVTSGGMTEVSTVAGIIGATTVRLASKLRGSYPGGALLWRQANGPTIEAASPGNWGNRIRVDLTPRSPGPSLARFDLRVTLVPGPDPTQPPEAERFLNLSLDAKDARFAPTIVNDPSTGSNLIRLSVPSTYAGLTVSGGRVYPFPVTLAGGRDGLSLVTARDFIGGDGDFRGLRALEEVAEIGILVAPDAVNAGVTSLVKTPAPTPDPCAPPPSAPPPDPVADDPTAVPRLLPDDNNVSGAGAVYQAMIDQARRLRYRVAVLDPPDGYEPKDVGTWLDAQVLPPAFVRFAAVYYPWVRVPDGLANELATRSVPPGGHVAGVYAQVDNSVGVQKPPANVELQFAVDLVKSVTDPQQGQLNERGIMQSARSPAAASASGAPDRSPRSTTTRSPGGSSTSAGPCP